MGDLLRLPLRIFRRAAEPAAPQPAGETAPVSGPPAVPSAEVVNLDDRRIPKVLLPWCPIPPYVGAFILGATISATTAAYVAADLSLVPGRIAVATFCRAPLFDWMGV